MTPHLTKDQIGNAGFATYADTTARTNLNCRIIQIVSDAVFTTLASATGTSGVTYPAGMILRGNFTDITLASGTINCYAE